MRLLKYPKFRFNTLPNRFGMHKQEQRKADNLPSVRFTIGNPFKRDEDPGGSSAHYLMRIVVVVQFFH